MKRTPLRRKTPLRAKVKPQGPRKPIKKRNPERYAKRHAEQFGEQAALCRMLPCCACIRSWSSWSLFIPGVVALLAEAKALGSLDDPGVLMRSWGCQAHHEPPRSCGGIDKDTVPLCVDHHYERHHHGLRAFEAKYRLDVRLIAAKLFAIVQEAKRESLPMQPMGG